MNASPNTVYYKRDGIVVTSRYFGNNGIRYDIRELSDLARSQGLRHPGVMLGLATAGVELMIAVPLLVLTHQWAGLAIAMPTMLVACLASYYCAVRWPARRELLAQHRGREVTLLATTDEHKFGQVTRALVRAMEMAELSLIQRRGMNA